MLNNSLAVFLDWTVDLRGVACLLGLMFTSWLFEVFPAWHGQGRTAKFVIASIAAALIAGLSRFFISQPQILVVVEPYFNIILVNIRAIILMGLVHRLNPGKGSPVLGGKGFGNK